MRLAAVQYRPPWGRPEEGREGLVRLVDRALAANADLVVCPEMATCGYVFENAEELRPHAEPAQGPTFELLSERARAAGAWIVCGFPEVGEDGLYNSAMVIGPKGELKDCYRKVLLYELDTTWATAGTRRNLLQMPEGTLSTGICMDLNDNGFALHLASKRPDIVAFCTNWLDEGHDILPYWRWRMMGWQGWFVAADRWGEERGTRFYGRSAILAPGGEVVAMAGPTGDAVVLADATI
jgi:predicted amidohydrolase